MATSNRKKSRRSGDQEGSAIWAVIEALDTITFGAENPLSLDSGAKLIGPGKGLLGTAAEEEAYLAQQRKASEEDAARQVEEEEKDAVEDDEVQKAKAVGTASGMADEEVQEAFDEAMGSTDIAVDNEFGHLTSLELDEEYAKRLGGANRDTVPSFSDMFKRSSYDPNEAVDMAEDSDVEAVEGPGQDERIDTGLKNEESESDNSFGLEDQHGHPMENKDWLVVNGREITVQEYFGEEWREEIMAFHAIEGVDIPGLRITLHEWQRKGAAQGHHSCLGPFKGILVGDAMGLGKTLLAISILKLAQPEPGFCVVVAPKSVCTQWQTEIQSAFTKKEALRTIILTDPNTTAHQLHAEQWDVVIASAEFVETAYRAMRDIVKRLEKNKPNVKRPMSALHSFLWLRINWPIKRLVIDEVQRVNKFDSARHVALKELHAKAVVMLSGTLTHNKWHDTAGAIHFMQGHPFTTFQAFLRTFATFNSNSKLEPEPDETRLRLLQLFLMRFTVARPADVLRLENAEQYYHRFPLSVDETVEVSFHYDKFEQAVKAAQANQHNKLNEALGKKKNNKKKKMKSDGQVLAHAIRAQLASLHIVLLDKRFAPPAAKIRDSDDEGDGDGDDDGDYEPNDVVGAVSNEPKGAVRKLWLKHIEDNKALPMESTRVGEVLRVYQRARELYPDDKIIICSQFLKFLDLIKAALKSELQIEAFDFNGVLPERTRQHSLAAFQSSSTNPSMPLLLTAGCGGLGLNITAASIVIQTEVWWNRNNELQMLCRCQRQGQKKLVKVVRLEAENSYIDVHMKKVQCQKARVNSRLMGPIIRRHDEMPVPPENLIQAGFLLPNYLVR